MPGTPFRWTVLAVAAFGAACASPAPVRTAPVRPAAARPTPPDLFGSAVRPVLARRCTPCHEPGGRMYGRMPFDSPDVVASHREGVLRRLKEPDERAAFEGWLRTRPPG